MFHLVILCEWNEIGMENANWIWEWFRYWFSIFVHSASHCSRRETSMNEIWNAKNGMKIKLNFYYGWNCCSVLWRTILKIVCLVNWLQFCPVSSNWVSRIYYSSHWNRIMLSQSVLFMCFLDKPHDVDHQCTQVSIIKWNFICVFLFPGQWEFSCRPCHKSQTPESTWLNITGIVV